MYADYSFYTDKYHGKAVPEADFTRLSVPAGTYIDKITFDRAQSAPEQLSQAVKLAECAVIDALWQEEQHADIASETVGKHTVAYVGGDVLYKVTRAASLYLAGTGLLFAGV